MITKSHHFYLLTPSPWPLVLSLGVFNLLYSFLMLLKLSFWLPLCSSIVLLFTSSFFWWSSYSGELVLEGFTSLSMENSIKIGMLLFISSEVFFFLSFFWSYFHFWLSPVLEISLIWPPLLVEPFCFLNVPLVNTLILVFSGATLTLSHHFLIEGEMEKTKKFLSMTWMLGFIFTLLQGQEYLSSFFSISDSNFGSSFFMLTGFHGIHVMIGTVYLVTVFSRLNILNNFKFESVSFELSAWYWHFVDVVWIFLYFLLYYMNY